MYNKFNINVYNIDVKKRRSFDLTVDKNTIIGDILDFDETTAQYFLEMGMHCLGCPSSRGETIEQACMVHDTDADELVKKINDHISAK